MKILLTGCAGFIGSHMAERLLADGHTVVGLDNFDPFYAHAVKQANMAGFIHHAAFTFEQVEMADAAALDAFYAKHGPFDAIVHLAAKAGVRPSIADPMAYQYANIIATANLLQLAAGQERKPKILFASSSSVYGNNEKVPFAEDDPVDRPISPYAQTKKAGELLCHTYHHLYDMDIWALRFFTVYGPRQRPDLAIHKFTARILAGEPIEMFGDGSTSRDYTYVGDIINATAAALDRCKGFEIINLGSHHPVTLKEMIATIEAACGTTATIIPTPMQPGDVNRTYADTAKAQALLDYAPATPFADGVAEQVNWFKEQG